MMMNKYGDGVCGCDGGGWCRWCSLRNAITTLRMSYSTREHNHKCFCQDEPRMQRAKPRTIGNVICNDHCASRVAMW